MVIINSMPINIIISHSAQVAKNHLSEQDPTIEKQPFSLKSQVDESNKYADSKKLKCIPY